VRRLLERLFGELPDGVVERITSADINQLEIWSLRVLDAQSLEDVFR
jgi:hypothetical protein